MENLNEKKQELMLLMQKREKIEKEIESFDKELVDKEGYPREDLDFGQLHSYKNLKKRLNELQNDYTFMMKNIEKRKKLIKLIELFNYHSQMRESGEAERDIKIYEESLPKTKKIIPEIQKIEEPKIVNIEKEKEKIDIAILPFAKISEVAKGSPSENAGFINDDLIVVFGIANYYNNDNLKLLVDVAKSNIDKEINVLILRKCGKDEEEVNYKEESYKKLQIWLIPKLWNGKGLVGYIFFLLVLDVNSCLVSN